ncbi:ADP-ribose pyrophosphatase YjhB, NUDIX family [Haladaptatus litoreus]|uniref:ADP-ribose pyrophosphatase YjhB, NUDIX family n=1 Tax=Haladaptatus litoreus TaxID=553468 RepID=A0A1N7DIX9_9EURY|nr:NUDIX hydrolase N-terminal domain-containing protein [Haladaptatus litoreus]SIR75782.1 ADP-ribose pyrophosphatase YjhB, NUDIX family [Haladaptatus litoreus]
MNLMRLLDELRILSQNGLEYADNPYDKERYERILTLTSQYYGKALSLPPAEVRNRFAAEFGHITPKVGAEAAIFNSAGDILLMQRVDDGTWCLPCGWVDPNESPADTAVRETKEETGLNIEVAKLIDVYYHAPSDEFGPHGRIDVLYHCSVVGGTLELSDEGEALEYWNIDDVPDWHKQHKTYAGDAEHMRSKNA